MVHLPLYNHATYLYDSRLIPRNMHHTTDATYCRRSLDIPTPLRPSLYSSITHHFHFQSPTVHAHSRMCAHSTSSSSSTSARFACEATACVAPVDHCDAAIGVSGGTSSSSGPAQSASSLLAAPCAASAPCRRMMSMSASVSRHSSSPRRPTSCSKHEIH